MPPHVPPHSSCPPPRALAPSVLAHPPTRWPQIPSDGSAFTNHHWVHTWFDPPGMAVDEIEKILGDAAEEDQARSRHNARKVSREGSDGGAETIRGGGVANGQTPADDPNTR